jgi:hypothetical protein
MQLVPSTPQARVLAILLGVVLAAGASSIAWADIPDSGVISSCFEKSGGDLRVIDSSAGREVQAERSATQLESGGPCGTRGTK